MLEKCLKKLKFECMQPFKNLINMTESAKEMKPYFLKPEDPNQQQLHQ